MSPSDVIGDDFIHLAVDTGFWVRARKLCSTLTRNKTNKQLGNRRIAMTRRYVIRKGDWYTIPPEWGSYHSLRIEGSSNGLVCMSSIENQICLTNPSTLEFRKLKKPPILPKKWKRYGFGYDSPPNDYKLVMAIDQGSDDGTLVQIFSLKSNVWKLFGHVDYRFDDASLLEPGILFNGALHWFMYDINRDKILIVSFDLAKEEFKEISQPDDTRYDGSYDNALGIFEDHLCIFDEHNDVPYGIWVMKNYNVKQSWKLLPTDCEMKDRVHYMIKDSLLSKKMPCYLGVELLKSAGEGSESILKSIWHHSDALVWCSMKFDAGVTGFRIANQAGLDTLETTLVALQVFKT
ncbi:F-box/kelch-repeat protein-like protein [Tanacetum coccineum]